MNRTGEPCHSRRLFWTALLALVASGCSVTPPHVINEKYREVLSQRHNNYQLKPGDMIRLETANRDDPTLNQISILVLPDGRTDLFHLHNYRAEGKTVSQVEGEMAWDKN